MKYNIGDKVYCRPIQSIWLGTIEEVINEFDGTYYLVNYGPGFCIRRECELFDIEKEAREYL